MEIPDTSIEPGSDWVASFASLRVIWDGIVGSNGLTLYGTKFGGRTALATLCRFRLVAWSTTGFLQDSCLGR